MTDETRPGEPAPVDSSADGTQRAEPEGATPPPCVMTPMQIGASALPDAIDRISHANPRSLGGEIGAALIAAATRHLSFELQETKHELRDARTKIENLQGTIAKRDVQIAVQEERIESISRGKHMRNLFMVFGTALLGFAIEFFRNNLTTYGWCCIVMGLGIIAGTLFSAPKAGKEVSQ